MDRAEQVARNILDSFGLEPSAENTQDRLIRMLDEERQIRVNAEQAAMRIAGEFQQLEGEKTFQTNRAAELYNTNQNQRITIEALHREVSDLRYSFNSYSVMIERQRAAALEARNDFERPVINKIPVIKAVRERFGMTLKDAKDVVDQWCLMDIDDKNAQEILNREDPGTFDEETEDVDSAGRPNYLHREALDSPRTVEVTITQNDIDEARAYIATAADPDRAHNCANARAVRRATGRGDLFCGTTTIEVGIPGGRLFAQLPEEVSEFVRRFDTNESVQPMTYQLEILD